MKKTKWIAGCIAAILCVTAPTMPTFAVQTMDIDTARTLAQENSAGVQDTVISRIQKEIELQQAKEGIRDIRKKENTVRFSLLFNIQLPEKHGMPKEIELIMKVPQILNELAILNKQEPYEMLKSQTDAETAYYDVLLADYTVNDLETRLADSKVLLQQVENKFKMGKGKQTDVEYMQNQIVELEGAYQQALLDQDAKRKTLSSLIGVDVRTGYTFTEYFPEVDISRSQLDAILAYAKENDFGLYQKTQARKLAEVDTDEILSIYRDRYSKYIGNIESYIQSHPDDMDYEEFIKLYNEALTEIDSPWEGSYRINLLFFSIYIPKEWFKGEYSGTRYMEDQKYALFVSLVERDKARQAEQTAMTQLEDSVYNTYSSLKQMESAYQNAEKALELAKTNYESKLEQNKRGLVEFTTLESSRSDFYTKQANLYEMKMEYAKALSSFNLMTAGYVNQLLEGGDFSQNQLEAGDTFASQATWYLDTSLTSQTFTFGVELPQEYDVDQYQLFYEGQAIGDPVGIDETIVHLPFTYQDTTLMEVRFYKDGVHCYTSQFDGGQYSGVLQLQQVAEVPQTDIATSQTAELGTWKVSNVDDLRKQFTLDAPTLEFASYELFYDQTSLGKAEQGKAITTLALYFSDMEQLQVQFYDTQGKSIASGILGEGVTSGKILQQGGSTT